MSTVDIIVEHLKANNIASYHRHHSSGPLTRITRIYLHQVAGYPYITAWSNDTEFSFHSMESGRHYIEDFDLSDPASLDELIKCIRH